MLLTNLTIARFQRKIRKFRLARSQSVTYVFRYTYCKKRKEKKAILSTTTENLVTPAPPTPDKGSIREIATGEITVSITLDDHLEGPYLLKTRELPGAPPPGPPPGALWRAPGPHPYEARASRTHGALRARIFRPPIFVVVNPGAATVPEASILGGWGGGGEPPPMKILGGKHIILPPQ